jgi:Uma2 family endonuclease
MITKLVNVKEFVLGPEHNGMCMTPAEFDAVERYDDNYVYELIHGVLVVNPIPLESEVGPNEELGYLLRYYRDAHPQGSALDATLPERYIRTADSRRKADRVIWAGLGRMPKPKVDPPTIVAEFVSKRKRDQHRDYVEKRQEYMAVNIKEYWIIDRFRRIMTVVTKKRGRISDQIIKENQVYRTPLLPGFELRLKRLFELAEDWSDEE